MERFENLLDFVNELNETGRIQYDDYSRLFDLVQEFAGAEEAINAAATDIAALLWLNGNCEYCEHGDFKHDNPPAHSTSSAAGGQVPAAQIRFSLSVSR